MKSAAIACFAILLFSLSAHAVEECNLILSDRIESSIQNLAKLRYDLDTQIASGESSIITRAMTVAFDQKYSDLSKTVIGLDERLKEQVTKIQSGEVIASKELDLIRQQQEKMFRERVIDIVKLDPLVDPRSDAAIVKVSPDEVLVTGGLDQKFSATSLSSIELYNVKSGRSEIIGHLSEARNNLRLMQLGNGKVLAWGGSKLDKQLGTAEIIDPVRKTVTPLKHELFSDFGFYLLPSKKIFQFKEDWFSTLDWQTGKQVDRKLPIPMKHTYYSHSQQPDGSIILVGSFSSVNSQVMRIDGKTLQVTELGRLDDNYFGQAQVSLNDHQVVITESSANRAKVVMFDFNTGKTTHLGNLLAPRKNHQAVLLSEGKILVLGGYAKNQETLHSAEVFDIDSGESTYLGEMDAGGVGFTTTLTERGVVVSGKNYPMTLELIRMGGQ